MIQSMARLRRTSLSEYLSQVVYRDCEMILGTQGAVRLKAEAVRTVTRHRADKKKEGGDEGG